MSGSPCSVWLWEGCHSLRQLWASQPLPGEGQEVAAGGRGALEMGLLVTGAASRSPDTELEGRHGGKFIAWAASAFGRGSRGVAGSRGLASPSPNSHFSKPPFLPLKVIFLSKIIYEWKTVCSRRAPPTHTQIFPSHSNLWFALISWYKRWKLQVQSLLCTFHVRFAGCVLLVRGIVCSIIKLPHTVNHNLQTSNKTTIESVYVKPSLH